jgi:hypothetical protein
MLGRIGSSDRDIDTDRILRMVRRLLDPTPGDGGGATPPAPPATPVTPAPPAATPPPPAGITLTADQHKALLDAQAELTKYRQAETEREQQKREAEEKRLREKGEFETLLKSRDKDLDDARRQLAETEARSKRSILDRELALAIAGGNVLDDWPPHLMRLWRDRFTVEPDGDSWTVRTLDGKSPAEFVKAQLALPEFSPLVRADGRGGAPRPGDPSGRAPEAPAGLDPSKPGHAALSHYLQGLQARQQQGFAPMGLKPVPAS